MVAPGAYAASLKRLADTGDKVRMLWQHDPAEPIGRWLSILEDARGLRVTGRLNLAVQRAREIAALDERRAQLERDVADRLSDAEALAQRIRATEHQRDEGLAELTEQLRATEAQRDDILERLTEQLRATETQRDVAISEMTEQLRATEAQRDEGLATLNNQLQATEAQRDQAVAQLRSTEARWNEIVGLADAAREQARMLQSQLAVTEAQRDEMADIAEARWTTIEELQDHAAQLQAHLQATEQTLATTAAFLEKERETILKPIYRRLY